MQAAVSLAELRPALRVGLCLCKELVMGDIAPPTVDASDNGRDAWLTLDEASQSLVRAEALVLLLRSSVEVEEHHRYGADIAWEHLRDVKAKLNQAQSQIRPTA